MGQRMTKRIPRAEELRENSAERSAVRSSCRKLSNFLEHCWPYLPRATAPLSMKPYVGVMCEYLEAAFYKLPDCNGVPVDRLIFNLPPGMLKSVLCATVFPAWVWSLDPTKSFLSISYSITLGLRDATDSRYLMESDWFRMLWPYVDFREDTNAKGDYRNTAGGFRITTTRGGRVTGEHFDFFLWEDPLNVKDRHDARVKNDCREFYNTRISTRGVDRGRCDIIDMQRIAVDDPCEIGEKENESYRNAGKPERWQIVKYPMRADPENAMVDKGFGGEYRKEGELLDGDRFDEAKIADMEMKLGVDASAQLAQAPKHAVGSMFDVARVQVVQDSGPLDRVVRYFDQAATKDAGCFTAGVLLGFNKDDHLFILDVHRGQWDPGGVMTEMQACGWSDFARFGEDRYKLIFEETDKHQAYHQLEKLQGIPADSDKPSKDKQTRAGPLAQRINRIGNVYMVKADWNADFLDELRRGFDGKYKDQIDACAAGYNWLYRDSTKVTVPVIMPRQNLLVKECASPHCDRPVEDGEEFCCLMCNVASEWGEEAEEHTGSCNFRHSNET